jgi:DNA-binding HxlR family transcriptional regulator
MSKYGQYCPVAKSLDILGDRWTLLIIRDMLTGVSHFNELERGLPGISRAVLANRLQRLCRAGVIEKLVNESGRQTTTYRLTLAGQGLSGVIGALWVWGEVWAFGDPALDELDPVLLMWWMRRRVEVDLLPARRVVAQFDFYGAATLSFWLILTRADVTLCLTDPGYEVQVSVLADLATLYRVWGQRISYRQALAMGSVRVEGQTSLVRAFPRWFGWEGTVSARAMGADVAGVRVSD